MNELAVALEWKICVIRWIEEKRGRQAATDGLLKSWGWMSLVDRV